MRRKQELELPEKDEDFLDWILGPPKVIREGWDVAAEEEVYEEEVEQVEEPLAQFALPHDAAFFEELQRLGKTADCKCRVEIPLRVNEYSRPTISYSLRCPVHYPLTSTLFSDE